MDGTIPQVASGLVFEGTLDAQVKLTTELALARLEFADIEKDRQGQYGYQTFKYATLGMLTAATLPALANHGIAVLQAITTAGEGRQRITTMLCGHGARIISSLDFDPRLTATEKGEPIKEYGKLRTYLRRYEYQTILMLDAEPDADEAGMKPDHEPQKRREAPRPPEPRQEQRRPQAPREPARQAQQEPPSRTSTVQTLPPPTPKPDPLAEKLATPVISPVTAVPVSAEPRLDPEADEPADEDLQQQLLAVYRQAGMTKIQFSDLCIKTVGVPSTEVRNSAKMTRKVLEAVRAKIPGAA